MSTRTAHEDELKAYHRAWYLAHREVSLANDKVRYQENRECRLQQVKAYQLAHLSKRKQYMKRYRNEHCEEISVYQAQNYRDNNELIRARSARWRIEHPEAARKTSAVRQARHEAHLRRLPRTLSKQQWEAIKRAYAGRCAYCGTRPSTLTMDHVIPVSKGGGTISENIVPACARCNSSKGNREAPVLPAVRLMI